MEMEIRDIEPVFRLELKKLYFKLRADHALCIWIEKQKLPARIPMNIPEFAGLAVIVSYRPASDPLMRYIGAEYDAHSCLVDIVQVPPDEWQEFLDG